LNFTFAKEITLTYELKKYAMKNQKLFTKLFVLVLLFFGYFFQCYSQDTIKITKTDTVKYYLISLHDGTKYNGAIVDSSENELILRTEKKINITIPTSEIKEISLIKLSEMNGGEYRFPNPHGTRYLFAPSAIPLKPGEGYYQNVYLFLNSFHVGVSKNLSFGAGFEFLTTFGGLAAGDFKPSFFVAPKLGFKISDDVHAGGGIILAGIPSLFSNGYSFGGIAYGIVTIGDIEHNITGGIGLSFGENEISKRPVFVLNGMTRVGKRISLVTENWIILTENKIQPVFSYGIRFFGEKLCVDLALLNNKELAELTIVGIPYIDFVVKF